MRQTRYHGPYVGVVSDNRNVLSAAQDYWGERGYKHVISIVDYDHELCGLLMIAANAEPDGTALHEVMSSGVKQIAAEGEKNG